MLMPKKNLVAIYEHLFTEGVIVAMKDTHAPKHPGKKGFLQSIYIKGGK